MIGVDTNVLARLFVADDPRQHLAAVQFFKARTADDPAFVSLIVVAELVWLLDRTYEFPKLRILELLSNALESPDFRFERHDLVESAVRAGMATKAGVADALIDSVAALAMCSSTVTFDTNAAKYVPGMSLLS